MNPPNAAPDSLVQGRYYVEKLKASFSTTWNDTRNVLEFLSQTTHRQTERIQSLELHAAELERINHEKNAQIETMEARFIQVNKAFNDLIAQKETQLLQVRSHNHKLQAALKHSHGIITDSCARREAAEEMYRNATAELETFQAQLGEGQEQGQSYGRGLSEEQLASIEAALKNELDKRSQVVWNAATAIANQAADTLNTQYAESQARVMALEKQLRCSSGNATIVPNGATLPATLAGAYASPTEPEPSGAGVPSRVITSMYPPKPSLVTAGEGSSVAGTVPLSTSVPDSDAVPPTLSNPLPRAFLSAPQEWNHAAFSPTAPGNAHLPAALAQEVIDLTESPVGSPPAVPDIHPTPDAEERPVKRGNVGSEIDRPPSQDAYGNHPNVSSIMPDVSNKDAGDAIGIFEAIGGIQGPLLPWKQSTPEN